MPSKKTKCLKRRRSDRKEREGRQRLSQASLSQSSQNQQDSYIDPHKYSGPTNGNRCDHIGRIEELNEVESSYGDQPGPAPTQALQQDNMYVNKYFLHHN